MSIEAMNQELVVHQNWCASLTQLLTSNPPQPAPCNCKPEINLLDNEVLRVTPDGQFIWHPDADRMIEEGDYSASPAMPHILRALRKREWVGLTDEEINEAERLAHIRHQKHRYSIRGQQITPADDPQWHYARAIEAKLKEKNK